MMIVFALIAVAVQSQVLDCTKEWCCGEGAAVCNVASATLVDDQGQPSDTGAFCKCECTTGYLSGAIWNDPLYLGSACSYCGGHNNVTGWSTNPMNGTEKSLPQPADTYYLGTGDSQCDCDSMWAGSKCDTCPSPFTGSRCNQCEPQFDQSSFPHCDVCADGYFYDPRPPAFGEESTSKCKKADLCNVDYCTAANYVPNTGGQPGLFSGLNNVKSAHVDPTTKTCECTCSEGWFGKMQVSGVSTNTWAACQYCQGQGVSYTGTTYTNGKCTCTGKWTDEQNDPTFGGAWGCGDCPFEYGPNPIAGPSGSTFGAGCNQCADGWTKGGYPTCDMSNDNPLNVIKHGIEAWVIVVIIAAILIPCCLILLCCYGTERLLAVCCFFYYKNKEKKNANSTAYGLLEN